MLTSKLEKDFKLIWRSIKILKMKMFVIVCYNNLNGDNFPKKKPRSVIEFMKCIRWRTYRTVDLCTTHDSYDVLNESVEATDGWLPVLFIVWNHFNHLIDFIYCIWELRISFITPKNLFLNSSCRSFIVMTTEEFNVLSLLMIPITCLSFLIIVDSFIISLIFWSYSVAINVLHISIMSRLSIPNWAILSRTSWNRTMYILG